MEIFKTLQKELDDVKAKLEALENEMKRKDDEFKAILIKIEKKEKETEKDNEEANKTDDTEETHKVVDENHKTNDERSNIAVLESKLETYCPECDIIFRLGELLIYRNHCVELT